MNRLTIPGIILLVSVFTVGCSDPNAPIQINPAFSGRGLQTRPTDINISLRLCPSGDRLTLTGSYISGGLIEDEGNATSQAKLHGPDPFDPNLVAGVLVLESEVVDGTITIRFQLQDSGPDFAFPVLDAVDGTWAILGGAGVYENLHGRGTARTEVVLDLSNECGVPNGVILISEFTGQADFDSRH